jgi:uncharacterized membrane protein YobD (UPF0266 family)
MIAIDVAKLVLSGVILGLSIATYRNGVNRLSVDRLKKHRWYSRVMVGLSLIALLLGPVAALLANEAAVRLWLNAAYGAVFLAVLGVHAAHLRHIRQSPAWTVAA